MIRRKLFTVCTLIILVISSGCSFAGNTDKDIDKEQEPVTKTGEAALYFADDQAMYLVPEIRQIQYEDNLPQALLEEIVKGPKTQGLNPTLPKTTRILGVRVENGIAFVDLSSDFERDYPGGTTGEGMALGSIVQSLTETEGIYAVQILIEGKKVEVLAKGHVGLNEPLQRHVTLGNVEIGIENNQSRQQLTDEGKNQWLLDPVESARHEGPLYGMYALGQYELIKKTGKGEYSGIGEAQVRHSYLGEIYDIFMIQPEKQGPEGIWTINSIMPYGTKEEALESFFKTRILQPAQDGHVLFVYEILGEKDFDNRKTLYLWLLGKEFVKSGNGLEEKSGISVPVAITYFAQDDNHNKVLEYRMPLDGAGYGPSLEQIFPENIRKKISTRQGNVTDLEKRLTDKAESIIK